ncbi:MAG: ribonuclease E/G [Pseudobutyrivibrio sp.]|nr:ribonuclease E/G [Pseudobutyrivibrio sp.]
MSIKKIVITKGIYKEKELRLLVSFDEKDKPLDIINLDVTKVGTVCEATVEKVLTDIDACILKLSTGDKGFIENKKLKPEFFTVRHSEKKLVCQEDRFWVTISQDRKNTKPYSCKFLPEHNKDRDFIDYYVAELAGDDFEVISDLPEINQRDFDVRIYEDDSYSLWNLNGLTAVLDRVLSKVVHLKSGGNLIFESTEALTIIDVNSSKNYGRTSAFDTNLEAIEELSRQLRLRSISGIIIIDLLKVSKDEEKELISSLKEACKDDISQVTIHGFTNLGLLEVTRSRIFYPFNI